MPRTPKLSPREIADVILHVLDTQLGALTVAEQREVLRVMSEEVGDRQRFLKT